MRAAWARRHTQTMIRLRRDNESEVSGGACPTQERRSGLDVTFRSLVRQDLQVYPIRRCRYEVYPFLMGAAIQQAHLTYAKNGDGECLISCLPEGHTSWS